MPVLSAGRGVAKSVDRSVSCRMPAREFLSESGTQIHRISWAAGMTALNERHRRGKVTSGLAGFVGEAKEDNDNHYHCQ